jgi:HSP20 family protein
MAESREAKHPEGTSPSSPNPSQQQLAKGREQEQARELSRSQPMSSSMMSPFSFMRRFMSDMDSLFEDFGFGATMPSSVLGSAGGVWAPHVDITTRDNQLLIVADLPGLSQEDVNVTVQEGVLRISGERLDKHEEDRGGIYRRERRYGSFRRDVALPEGVDPESIRASFENGVLEVSMPLPKEAAPAGRTIPIGPKQTGGPDVH